MKLPRLPNKCSVFDAKYSADQMRKYGENCIKQYILLNTPQISIYGYVPPPVQKSIIEKIKEVW
jgi:hypothetical protein